MKTEPPGPGMTSPPIAYSTRNDAFSPPCLWVIYGPVLREERKGEAARTWPLAEIAEVNLKFTPTRPERTRYRCRLRLRDGRKAEFFNRTYEGIYQFRETNGKYVAFVTALHRALVSAAPGCRYTAGATSAAYALNLAVSGFVVLMLIVAFVYFLTVGLLPVVAIKVIFIVFYLPAVLGWFRRNRPLVYAADRIPAAVLPPVEPPPLPA